MKKILFCLLLHFSVLSFAYHFDLESSEYQTQLIELFTSEGCSSCPPADRWLSSLKNQPGLWDNFIPLAYHVNYWDYIGWKDKYASPEHAVRQRLYKKTGNIRSVYTPGVIKAGKEWRHWGRQNINRSDLKVGKLKVTLKDNKLSAHFLNKNNFINHKLTIALVAMNLETSVRAGENAGKNLKHDFVVLKQQNYMFKQSILQVDIDHGFFKSPYDNLAFVAWVTSELNPAPIQAVGRFL